MVDCGIWGKERGAGEREATSKGVGVWGRECEGGMEGGEC